MKNTFYIIILLFLFGCDRNRKAVDTDTIVIHPTNKIIEINDSTLLSLVSNIKEDNGVIYFSDSKNNRLVCTDTNYKFIRSIGSLGKGPSDFNFPIGVFVNNKGIYAIDEGNKKINIYDLTGKYINNINNVIPYRGRFIVDDSVFYGSSINKEAPLFKSHLNGKLIKRFGNNNRLLKNINQHMSKNFLLEKWKHQIIAICDSDPVIERYSTNGELLGYFDYSNLDYISDYVSYVESEENKNMKAGLKGKANFCLDSYMKDDRLYILLGSYDKKNKKVECNHILVLEVGEEKITPLKMLILRNDNGNDSWYLTFCLMGNKLIAYDALSYEVHEFQLPN